MQQIKQAKEARKKAFYKYYFATGSAKVKAMRILCGKINYVRGLMNANKTTAAK